MITKKLLLIVLIHVLFKTTFAQGEFVVEINRATGQYVKTGPKIANVTWIYPNIRTYNENTNTYIFPSSQIDHRLFSINTSNGTIVYNPLINNISKFQFHNTNNSLYGIEQDNANNIKKFILIDPITGTYTQIGNSLPSSGMFQGYRTIDEINNRFIFLDPPNILYSINTINGNIISNPNLVLNSGENIINFKFDNSTGILYGLLQDNNLQKYFLVTIDPATGIYTRIGSGSIFGIGGGTATIDETNQEYIYMYNDGLGGHEITTLDISNGNVIYNSTIPTDISDNFHGLEFDNTNNKLYSLHWDSEIASSIEGQHFTKNEIVIYPNPTYDKIIFENIDCELEEIVVYNTLGQNVTSHITINEVNTQTIINLMKLDDGIYYVKTKNIVNKVCKQ
ncbi:MAG: hypothetical protein B7C24_08300 [Bacteroidetes bacterium 4572_77]|nr:MAG: hypothetical protein B7C24_08300 [Bacteroidetes bacterium 4572_77]